MNTLDDNNNKKNIIIQNSNSLVSSIKQVDDIPNPSCTGEAEETV